MGWKDGSYCEAERYELPELKSLCKKVEPSYATGDLINVRKLTLST